MFKLAHRIVFTPFTHTSDECRGLFCRVLLSYWHTYHSSQKEGHNREILLFETNCPVSKKPGNWGFTTKIVGQIILFGFLHTSEL